MPRKPPNFHQLKRPKVRQSWSKYNLYNLSRISTPPATLKTFFQQKWIARAMTRGYHHPQIKEKHWSRMFDRRLPAVVSMNYNYLAKSDGSEMALGTGSGEVFAEDLIKGDGSRRRLKTPYMHMTFHPLERRLDTMIWRALFASSTLQARQFVVHGGVKVNGKKMIHPGYQLNPGDMFSVDPNMVMFATGMKKVHADKPWSSSDELEIKGMRRSAAQEHARRRAVAQEQKSEEGEATIEDGVAATETTPEKTATPKSSEEAQEEAPTDSAVYRQRLKSLKERASNILQFKGKDISAKRKQELRDFVRQTRKTFGKAQGTKAMEADSVEDLEAVLNSISLKIPEDALPKNEAASVKAASAAPADQQAANPERPTTSNPQGNANQVRRDAELLQAAIERVRENPIDSSKPYATPWRPREYMSAFAFIPRYLEVNQNVCSAVYLRHPVARPGLAEVPTPFHTETMGLAFNWYLRRR